MTTPVAPRYSVVAPCYNTGPVLRTLAEKVEEAFSNIGLSYELILVNDGSPAAHTWPTIRTLAEEMPAVIGINLMRNSGQGAATLAGLAESRGQFVFTIDDDLQHNPSDFGAFIAQEDHDIVIGHLQGRKDSRNRQLGSKLKSYFDYIVLKKPKHIRLSGFRLLRREVVDGMLTIRATRPFIPALMFLVSHDVVNVPVAHNVRLEGTSNYTFIKRLRLFSLIIINNSTLVLQMISYLGGIIALISLVSGVYYFLQPFFGTTPPAGWTSTFIALLFFGGMIMFTLGLIGEYLMRTMESVESRPAYLIRTITGRD